MHSRQFYQGSFFYEYNFQLEFFSAQICFRMCEVKGRKVKKINRDECLPHSTAPSILLKVNTTSSRI